MFAAQGANTSIEFVQNKSSACVEVLRSLVHDVAAHFGANDYHRRHCEVDYDGDLKALLVDLAEQDVHTLHSNRLVPAASNIKQPAKSRSASAEIGRAHV